MIFSHVFVLSTGRCGSTTFVRACQHLNNYSAGHETRTHLLHPERLNYPTGHIESDNRLSWFLGRLDAKFGNNACYVHLIRPRESCVQSLAKRIDGGIMQAYAKGILLNSVETDPIKLASDYYDTVNANIESFLCNKPFQITVRLPSIKDDFRQFLSKIDAEGNLKLALNEWDLKHNAS